MKNQEHFDPLLSRLAEKSSLDFAVALHSGRFETRWAKQSLFAMPRHGYRFDHDGQSRWIDHRSGESRDAPIAFMHEPFEDVRRLLHWAERENPQGRWVGYFSYDLAGWLEPEKLASLKTAHHRWPLIELAWCPQLELMRPPPITDLAHDPIDLAELRQRLAVQSDMPGSAHMTMVQRAIDAIAAGDVFQVNLAQGLRCEITGTPRELYRHLARISPAWYAALLELPPLHDQSGRRGLLSISPELFLQVDGGRVVTRPIKGTLPVSQPAEMLRDSLKDQAELNMIVDLMRNDLGRVCRFGSVRVAEPRTIETHPTIHHGVAEVVGQLRAECDVMDLLRATLPGGSVTGAPKVRAMQLIHELEASPRGPYCGCIGWLNAQAACLNIAIRTMTLDPIGAAEAQRYHAQFHVGGGIVADSDPLSEYHETLDKARAMLLGLHAAQAERVGDV